MKIGNDPISQFLGANTIKGHKTMRKFATITISVSVSKEKWDSMNDTMLEIEGDRINAAFDLVSEYAKQVLHDLGPGYLVEVEG